jgi:DNA-binding PadR family transcriptional regulator
VGVPTFIKILFKNLRRGDVLLLLYRHWNDIRMDVFEFIRRSLKNDELFLVVSDHVCDILKNVDKEKLYIFSEEDMIHFTSKADELYSYAESKEITLKIFINLNSKKIEIFEYLKAIKNKKDLVGITAFNMASLDHETIAKLVEMHDKVAFFGLLSRTFSDPLEEDIGKFVKKHLETIVLFLLRETSMCGYDLIKEIFNRYGVLISQGTLYPLLYSLTKDGILNLKFKEGDMRAKIYFPSEEGREVIERKLNEFINAGEYTIDSIKSRDEKCL